MPLLNLPLMGGFRSSISSVPFKAAITVWVGSSPQVCSCVCVLFCGCALGWRSRRTSPGCHLAETLEGFLLRKIFLQEGRVDSSMWTIFFFLIISCIKYTNTGKYRERFLLGLFLKGEYRFWKQFWNEQEDFLQRIFKDTNTTESEVPLNLSEYPHVSY